MREVRFEAYDWEVTGNLVYGSIADLVEAIPYLLVSGVIPPLSVLNDVLATGQRDAGMSGGAQWEPLQLDAADWDELRAGLVQRGHRFIEPPSWVCTHQEWYAWLFEHLYGIPADEHLRLTRQDDELGRALEQARVEGNEARATELYQEQQRVGGLLSDLFSKHLRK